MSSKVGNDMHFKNETVIQFSKSKECPHGNLIECSVNIRFDTRYSTLYFELNLNNSNGWHNFFQEVT